MSNKKASTYKAVFNYIESIYSLKPATMITDYENGLRKAIKECYPYVHLNGCWFHYCFALRRKALKLKLHGLIYKNENGNIIFYQLKCIPLLPSLLIHKGFKIVKKNARMNGLQKYFSPLFRYWENYWLKIVSFLHEICLLPYIFIYKLCICKLQGMFVFTFNRIQKIRFQLQTLQ